MKATRRGVAIVAVLGLGLGLVACRGSDDDDSADSVATEDSEPAGTTAETDAGGTTAGTTEETTEETTAGTTDETTAGSDGEVPVNEAAAAVDCPDSEPGLTDTSIKLGGTYPLSGPVAAYASIPKGIDAWFQHLNDTQGGITSADGNTREIEWTYLDDQYTPPRTLENARLLVEQEDVWLVLNPLGTPPNTAIRDYMNQSEVPQLLVATGAATWGRDIEQYPWTIGYQPDYESEGIAYAQYALEQNPDAQIAIVYQNDDFGKDYLAGIKEGLGENADQLISEVTYEVTDATIDNQISQAKDSGADTLMLIATPQFAIQGIKRVNDLAWEGLFIVSSVSSSVAAVIEPAGFEAATGWISSVYLKDPTDPQYDDDADIVEYREILAEYQPDANPDDGFYVYGMSLAQTFQRLLEGMDNLCRASIMAAVKNFEWDEPKLTIPGVSISTSEADGDAFPIQSVQLEEWDGAQWQKFGEIIDASTLGE